LLGQPRSLGLLSFAQATWLVACFGLVLWLAGWFPWLLGLSLALAGLATACLILATPEAGIGVSADVVAKKFLVAHTQATHTLLVFVAKTTNFLSPKLSFGLRAHGGNEAGVKGVTCLPNNFDNCS
jgi:hypothetical protein